MGMQVPVFAQMLPLIQGHLADAAVVVAFDACDQYLFLVINHHARNDRVAVPSEAIGAKNRKSRPRQPFQRCRKHAKLASQYCGGFASSGTYALASFPLPGDISQISCPGGVFYPAWPLESGPAKPCWVEFSFFLCQHLGCQR